MCNRWKELKCAKECPSTKAGTEILTVELAQISWTVLASQMGRCPAKHHRKKGA